MRYHNELVQSGIMPAFISAAPLPSRTIQTRTLTRRRPCLRPRRVAKMQLETIVNALPLLPLAQVTPTLQAAMLVAGPGINLFNLVMIVRIILTWYPKTDLAKRPWIFIAVPTEPLLRATRKVVPPVGGVDISPIVWFAIMSFVHEILVGPQGLLVLLAQK